MSWKVTTNPDGEKKERKERVLIAADELMSSALWTAAAAAGGYCMEAIGTCVRDVLAGFEQEAHNLAGLDE